MSAYGFSDFPATDNLLDKIGKKLVARFGGFVTPVTLKLAGITVDLGAEGLFVLFSYLFPPI